MLRINIIGAGKVGRTFMSLIAAAPDAALMDVLGRDATATAAVAADIGSGRAVADLAQMRPADLWILSVPDDRIAQVAAGLAAARRAEGTPPVAVHCSGFLSSAVLAPLRDRGWAVASCHPVLSFADPLVAATRFTGTFCALEGDDAAVARVGALMAGLGGVPFPVDPDRKPLYHAAAVFSNNFTTVLQAIALEAWADAGVPADIARQLGATLVAGAADNVARLGPKAALTGPAARGDTATLRRQHAAVAAWHPDAATVYDTMSRLARRLTTDGTTLPQAEPRPRADPTRTS